MHKVKPEDVPPELAKILLEWTSIVPRQARGKVAEMANQMIEAGLVSPPCHVIKHDDGYVIDPRYDRKVRVWPGKAYGPNVEHYWGQEA